MFECKCLFGAPFGSGLKSAERLISTTLTFFYGSISYLATATEKVASKSSLATLLVAVPRWQNPYQGNLGLSHPDILQLASGGLFMQAGFSHFTG